MMFWIAPALIALVVAALMLRALKQRGDNSLSPGQSDMAVYRDQLTEVDRDLARGVLTEAEAETVRTEVSRRLLDADRRAAERAVSDENRFGLGAGLVVAAVFAGSFLLYSELGAPGVTDLPMKARLADLEAQANQRISQAEAEENALPFLPEAPPAEDRFLELMEQLRETTAERPGDIQGLTLLADNEIRLGNFAASREAREKLVAAYGDDVPLEERIELLNIMVYAAGGFVSPEAEDVLTDILLRAPENQEAHYYSGLLFSQTGRPDRAFPIWERLLETSPPNAPWLPVIRSQIAALAAEAGVNYRPPEQARGPSADDLEAAEDMSPEDRQEMIQGMVNGLAERLATEGGPAEDWAQLISALGVLGETDRAVTVADEAAQVFADDPAAVDVIEAARARLKP